MTWKTRHVTRIGDLPIAWLEAGPPGGGDPTARTVVLVHGLGTGDQWWTPTIPVLARNHRVLALDSQEGAAGPYTGAANAFCSRRRGLCDR